MILDVFVYGTLMPEHRNWPVVRDYVVERWQDVVPGQLYDTGWTFPAARFDEPGRIPGWGLRLEPARLAEAMALLDELEDEGDRYTRVEVLTRVGRPAWSYHWNLEVSSMTPIDAWAPDLEIP